MNFKVALFTLFVGMASVNCYSESRVENLSPELRALLKQEMVSIEKGMKAIIPAYISGELSEISEIAGQIKSSYILKQRISEAQKHELHEKLPQDFISKDQELHKYAGMLEHASKEKNTELIVFYYSKLLESCVGCHSQYAGHRFPNLTSGRVNEKHQH